jgi:hypothetical protein
VPFAEVARHDERVRYQPVAKLSLGRRRYATQLVESIAAQPPTTACDTWNSQLDSDIGCRVSWRQPNRWGAGTDAAAWACRYEQGRFGPRSASGYDFQNGGATDFMLAGQGTDRFLHAAGSEVFHLRQLLPLWLYPWYVVIFKIFRCYSMSKPHAWKCPYCNHNATITAQNESYSNHVFDHDNKDGLLVVLVESTICPNPDCMEYEITPRTFSLYQR